MTTKTILITGATDGIGSQTALQLGRAGARVLAHGRTEAKAREAVNRLERDGVTGARGVFADLSDMGQVRGLAEQVRQATSTLDVLVNNAGVFATAETTTVDGFELTFAVNHFAPFLLTHLLLDLVERAADGRVVNVSSVAHNRGRVTIDDLPRPRRFDGYGTYSASKLLNVYFTHELARRLSAAKRPVRAFALHPGVITTKLLQAGFGMSGASVESGALTSVFCATSASVGASGTYYSDAREVPCAAHANDPALERGLYEKSCQLVGAAPLTSAEPAAQRDPAG